MHSREWVRQSAGLTGARWRCLAGQGLLPVAGGLEAHGRLAGF
jgi:hypothetical protein